MILALGITLFFLCVVYSFAWPLGRYIACVIENPEQLKWIGPFKIVERLFSNFLGQIYSTQMTWKEYFFSLATFHALGAVLLWAFFRFQAVFASPFPDMSGDGSFNAAISFVTNTNWQSYVPETEMSWVVNMIGITTQQFLSAAVGISFLCVLGRAFRNEATGDLGNFWRDITRFSVYVLLPLSLILSVMLVFTGVPQSANGSVVYTPIEGGGVRSVPLGMYASQIAIKQLGTNGGGVFAANGAHPLENPSPISCLLELFAMLCIPMALCRTFGEFVRAPRQGRLLLVSMGALFIVASACAYYAESQEIPSMPLGSNSFFQAEGNMEGKECRFGPFWSVLWSVTTTATSAGAVNCCLSSLLPLTGAVSLVLMEFGEVIFGGIGTGIATALVFLLIAVFCAGLMVGRTPEYLGKKIEAREMKFVTLLAILPAAIVLLFLSITLSQPAGREALSSHGPHGITEALYAYTSATANNGSSFQGLSANTPMYNFMLGSAMYLGRLLPAALLLALAGALSEKKRVATSVGTLSTDSLAFGVWFCFVIVIVGALNFLPVFTLGPVIEHMMLFFPTT